MSPILYIPVLSKVFDKELRNILSNGKAVATKSSGARILGITVVAKKVLDK